MADEPTGDLDKPSANAIMQLLQRLNRDLDKTMIMVTHDPATSQYADSVLHLEKGRLVNGEGQEARA